LSYLKQIELIRERQRMEELEYLFKHALAQEAAYDSILHQKRKELHLQVARSIEKVFDERLHEFYGMLALHYIKGEDDEKAAYYLIKAGEEAMKASASNEALNYYQDGLKLYLQSNKDTADPEKLAMFEKNIAIALCNRCRWEEAVQHIDKVFGYWDFPAEPNKILTLIGFSKNIMCLFAGIDKVFKKTKYTPSEREKEIFDLIYKKCSALVFFDTTRCLFNALRGFNHVSQIDMATYPDAVNYYAGPAGVLAHSGLSYKLAYKLLSISKSVVDTTNIQTFMPYKMHFTVANNCSGNWSNIGTLEEKLIDKALKQGLLFDTVSYIRPFLIIKTETGDFSDAARSVRKLFEIGNTYNYNLASLNAHIITTNLLLNMRQLSEAQQEAERGGIFSSKYSTESHQLIFFGFKAEIQILLNNAEGTTKPLLQAKKIIEKRQIIPQVYAAPYLFAQFMTDIYHLKSAIAAKDKPDISARRKTALHSGKTALRKLRKFAPYRTKTLRLMGEYYWLIDKQRVGRPAGFIPYLF